ncbi:MAG: porin family protein [Chlamydiae bacterium]|nr:porin family protein [Chlamydiota bacterium]
MLNLKNTFTKAIFVFVAISNFAYASDTKFYLGLDASLQDLDLNTSNTYIDSGIKAKDYYKNKSINPSIFAGVDVLDFLKIEASYTQSSSDDISIAPWGKTNYQIKTKTIALDFKPYVKISDNFLAFAIVGASYNKININEKDHYTASTIAGDYSIETQTKGSATKLAPSVGLGLEYFVLPNLALRTQAKYTHLNVKTNSNDDSLLGKIQGMTHVNVGAAYYF